MSVAYVAILGLFVEAGSPAGRQRQASSQVTYREDLYYRYSV